MGDCNVVTMSRSLCCKLFTRSNGFLSILVTGLITENYTAIFSIVSVVFLQQCINCSCTVAMLLCSHQICQLSYVTLQQRFCTRLVETYYWCAHGLYHVNNEITAYYGYCWCVYAKLLQTFLNSHAHIGWGKQCLHGFINLWPAL